MEFVSVALVALLMYCSTPRHVVHDLSRYKSSRAYFVRFKKCLSMIPFVALVGAGNIVEGVSGWAANRTQMGKNVEARNLATGMN